MAVVHFAYALAMLGGILSAFLVYVLSPEFRRPFDMGMGFWLPLLILFSPRFFLFLPAFTMFVVSGIGFLKHRRRTGLVGGLALCLLWLAHTAAFASVHGFQAWLWYAPLVIYLVLAFFLLLTRYRLVFSKKKEPGEKIGKLRRFAVALPFAALLFLFATTTLISMAMIILGRDAPPPDTSDLARQRPAIPDAENAFAPFAEAEEVRHRPEDRRLIPDYLAGEDVDDDDVRETIEKNKKTFKKIGEGLERETVQVPEGLYKPRDGHGLVAIPLLPYLRDWRGLARLKAMKGKYKLVEGRYAEATDSCLMLLRFGDMIRKDDAEYTINALLGIALTELGLDLARKIGRTPDVSMSKLYRLSDALVALGPYDAALANALKGEYAIVDGGIGEMRDFVFGPAELYPLPSDRRNLRNVYYFFQPDVTRRRFVDHVMDIIDNISKPYSEVEFFDDEEPEGFFRQLFRPNAVGKYLVTNIMAPNKRILELKTETDTTLAGTRLIVACNLYRREKGRLPENLNSLVPEYLDSVPIDPYDGEPFRYFRAEAVVYSVGKNLEDGGGTDDDDIVFEIEKRNEENDNKKS